MYNFVFFLSAQPNTRDLLNPIKLQLTYKLPDQDAPPFSEDDPNLPDINSFPILDVTQNEVFEQVRVHPHFVPVCKPDALTLTCVLY